MSLIGLGLSRRAARPSLWVLGIGLVAMLSAAPLVLAGHHEESEFSEAKKIEIFQAGLAAERRAEADTKRKFPGDQETEAAMDYTQKQLNKYREQLSAKYGISTKQLTLITAEGYQKSWPTSRP
jgi:hypothetical protein